MYKFAKRVGIREFVELLSQMDTKDYALLSELKTFAETGRYHYNPECEKPNIMVDGHTYELTDEGINYHWPFTYGDDPDGGWHIQPGSRMNGQGKVREFYLRKFGQEYLDFLVGPNVAILTDEYIASSGSQCPEKQSHI